LLLLVCCAFFVFHKIEFLFLFIGSIYLWLSYLIIYYVLSLARHQDKYSFNYIWNLKHNRFVIVWLTWKDQIAIIRNLTCCQYIRFKTLNSFLSFKMEVLLFGSCNLQFLMFHLVATSCSIIINKICVIIWCSFANLASLLVSNSKGWISWCQMGALIFGFQSLMKIHNLALDLIWMFLT
jgi:hypothetical protein